MLLIFRPDLSLSDDTIPRSFRKRNFQISASGTANTWKRVETANLVVEPFKIGNRLLTYVSYAREIYISQLLVAALSFLSHCTQPFYRSIRVPRVRCRFYRAILCATCATRQFHFFNVKDEK